MHGFLLQVAIKIILYSWTIKCISPLRYGRDGANYTSRAIFDCYYNQNDTEFVVIDYQPQRWPKFVVNISWCLSNQNVSEPCSSWCSGVPYPEQSCSCPVSTCVSAASSCSLEMMATWEFSAAARLSQVRTLNYATTNGW